MFNFLSLGECIVGRFISLGSGVRSPVTDCLEKSQKGGLTVTVST